MTYPCNLVTYNQVIRIKKNLMEGENICKNKKAIYIYRLCPHDFMSILTPPYFVSSSHHKTFFFSFIKFLKPTKHCFSCFCCYAPFFFDITNQGRSTRICFICDVYIYGIVCYFCVCSISFCKRNVLYCFWFLRTLVCKGIMYVN